MQVTPIDLLHIIIALTILLFSSHLFGHFFQRTRQPRVIGEILAGLVLGPTVLKFFCPSVYEFIFNTSGPAKALLNIIYQLGLLHLMFCAGMEVNTRIRKQGNEANVVTWISGLGTVLPFAFGLLFIKFIDVNDFMGIALNEPAFILIFSLSIAVTSIPIISRILHDLKLMNTSFARIILSAAVIEDVLLYVVLAVALGMVGGSYEPTFGISAILGLEEHLWFKVIYHIIATVVFFVASLLLGPRLFKWLNKIHFTFFQTINPLAFLINFMLFMSGIAILLGIAPMSGLLWQG